MTRPRPRPRPTIRGRSCFLFVVYRMWSAIDNLEPETLHLSSSDLVHDSPHAVRMAVRLKCNRPFKGQRLAEQARRRPTETGGISSSGIGY